MSRWRTRHRGGHAERGAAAVEFAIVFVLLIFIVFSIIDFGRLLFVQQAVKSASREGARTAVVAAGNDLAVFNATAGSVEAARALAGGSLTVTGTPATGAPVVLSSSSSPTARSLCPTSGQSATVTVRVEPFRWFTPTLPLLSIIVGPSNRSEVVASTTMRCE